MCSIKKMFAGLLTLACAFAAFAMPAPASAAATGPFQITSGNTTHYAANLYEAIRDADSGTTITLLELGSDLKESTLTVSKNLTLNLNGFGWATKSTFTISGSLTIKDTSSNASGALAWNDQIKNNLFAVADNGKLTITGGKFGGNGSWTVSDSGSLVISGGKFQSKVDSKYLGEGAVCSENIDSDKDTYPYKVTKDSDDGGTTNDGTSADGSCKVTDADGNPIKDADGNVIVYKDLADALANAPEGAVITVNKDVVLDSTVKVPNSITLDLNGHKVSTIDGSACIEIADDKTVDIKDSGETKGSLGDIILGKNATANVAKDTTVGKVTAKDTGYEVKTTTNADGSTVYKSSKKDTTDDNNNNGDDGEELKANKAKLKSAIDAAKKIQKGKKSDAAWKALQDAIATAEAVYNNADASNSDVVSAITALANAEAAFASSDDADSSDNGNEDNNSNKNNGTKDDNGDKNSSNGDKDNNNKSNGNGNNGGGTKKALPQTGDTTPVAAMVSFAGAGAAALIGGVAINRRQRADARHMKR